MSENSSPIEFEQFPWFRVSSPLGSPDRIADKGRRAIRRLKTWGVDLHPQCRLQRAAARLSELAVDWSDLRGASDERLELLGECATACADLYVASHAQSDPPESDILEKFTVAVNGADMPSDEVDHLARNTQHELYVWGTMVAASAQCVVAEPDFVVRVDGHEFGIAAKMIWSPDQLRKRLSEAGDQILQSGIPGIVAVNAKQYLASVEETEPDLALKSKAFNQDVRRVHGHLPYLAKKPHVRGLYLVGSAFYWDRSIPHTTRLYQSVYNQWILFDDDGETVRSEGQVWQTIIDRLKAWHQMNF